MNDDMEVLARDLENAGQPEFAARVRAIRAAWGPYLMPQFGALTAAEGSKRRAEEAGVGTVAPDAVPEQRGEEAG